MGDSTICRRTDEGLKPIENERLREILLIKCEVLAACDGSPEIKISEGIKDEFIIRRLQQCNEEKKVAAAKAKDLKNRAARFSTNPFPMPMLKMGVEF